MYFYRIGNYAILKSNIHAIREAAVKWLRAVFIIFGICLGSAAEAAELAIRGFHLGMTIAQVDSHNQRQFGTGIEGFAVYSGAFFASEGKCGVHASLSPASTTQIKQLRSFLGDQGPDDRNASNVKGPRALALLDNLRLRTLIFPSCMFGVEDGKPIFKEVEALFSIPKSCYRLLPEDGADWSYCYKDGILLSFHRNSDGYWLWLIDPKESPSFVEQAKKVGVVPLGYDLKADHEGCLNPSQAFQSCSRLIDNPQTDASLRGLAYGNRGMVYREQGKFEEAIRDYKAASELEPKNPFVLLGLAVVQLLGHQYQACINSADAALTIVPRSSHALFVRGLARLQLGDVGRGNSDLQQARTIDPNIEEGLVRFGVVASRFLGPR